MKTSFAALSIMLALLAFSAGGASGAATTGRAEWYSGDPGTTVPEDLTTQAAVVSKFVLKGTSPSTIQIEATGLGCIGCKITNAEITGQPGAAAMAKGQLKFTGVTATTPTGCAVRNGTSSGAIGVIETQPLVIHSDWMIGTVAYQHFMPATGSTLATVYLDGASCAISGAYNLTGTIFGEDANATGVQSVVRNIAFSPTIETTAGATLSFAGKAAELTGTSAFNLTPQLKFGIH